MKLTEGFDLLATAPRGVARLRELILAFAVQGKLVTQDANDEPATDLLTKILAEREEKFGAVTFRRSKRKPELEQDEEPYELPKSWTWARLSDLTSVLNGRAYAKNELLESGGVPVLRVGNLFTSNRWYYSDLELEADKYCEPGDLLYAWSASFGPFLWSGPRAIYHYHIWKLVPHSDAWLNKHFLYTFLLEKTQEIKASGHGVAMLHMTKEKMEKILVPLPPLHEQGRIVAKVDELMRLCDELESRGRLEAEQHARLTATLFEALAGSASAHALAGNWARVAANFDLLLDRPEAIDALEQTILQLAVRGLLVSQDPTDEPAAELLRRLRDEKERKVAAGEAKREKAQPCVDPQAVPFGLPKGWEWARFEDLNEPSKPISYGVLVPGPDVPTGIPFVRLADLSIDSPPTKPEKTISPEVDAQYSRTRLDGGEILMGVVGSIGKLGVAPRSWKGANIARAICRIVPSSLLDRQFVLLLLQSKFMQSGFAGDTRTLAQPTLNVGLIRSALTPVPPLNEQRRIAARAEELRRLCADLRARLTDRQACQTRFAAALVEQTATAAPDEGGLELAA